MALAMRLLTTIGCNNARSVGQILANFPIAMQILSTINDQREGTFSPHAFVHCGNGNVDIGALPVTRSAKVLHVVR